MPAKKWIICGECKFFSECEAGQNKMQNVSISSPVYSEIGCYNHEQYYLLKDGKQLKLL